MKSNLRTIRIITISVVALILLTILVVRIYHSFGEVQEALEENLPSSYALTKDDSAVVKKAISRLRIKEVHKSKVRRPISELILDGKFNIIMYQLDPVHSNKKLSSLHIEEVNIDRSVGVTY